MKDKSLPLTPTPADTYIVVNKSIIDNEDRTILTMLYQPIIGSLPIMEWFRQNRTNEYWIYSSSFNY